MKSINILPDCGVSMAINYERFLMPVAESWMFANNREIKREIYNEGTGRRTLF